MNYSSKTNPNTKNREILAVNPVDGVTKRVAIIPRDSEAADRAKYGDLIEMACQVGDAVRPDAPQLAVAALPELAEGVRMSAVLHQVRRHFYAREFDAGERLLLANWKPERQASLTEHLLAFEEHVGRVCEAALAQLRKGA